LPGSDEISRVLRGHCETLGIRNIRVIKNVERLVRRIDGLLTEFPEAIRYQAAHSLTLFGWSKYDHENAPKLDFLKTSSLERHMQRDRGPPPKEEAVWDSLLEKYKFRRSDDFDIALMKYVDSMILDVDDIKTQAKALQEQQRLGELHGTFEAAWRAFHDSFADNEDEVVRQIVSGAKKSYEVISLQNMNEMILLLKKLGRDVEAREILKCFSDKRDDPHYWTEEDDPFNRGPLDPDIKAVIEEKKPKESKDFDVAAASYSCKGPFNADYIPTGALGRFYTRRRVRRWPQGLPQREFVAANAHPASLFPWFLSFLSRGTRNT
jgi:hypothetical protein